MQKLVYLDYNATGRPRPEMVDVMAAVLAKGGNPSSVHVGGREAKRIVEKARDNLAAALNCKPQEIIFTSGGTESNNMALRNSAAKSLIIPATEHDSVLAAANASGLPIVTLPVDRNGLVDCDALAKALASSAAPALVSIMLANNETGVIQSIADIARMVHDAGGVLHCDGVQAFGKIALDFQALGADFLSITAHKIGGPHGIGALVVRDSILLSPLIVGGGQETGRRSGTENIAGIAGFASTAELAVAGLPDFARLAELRDRLESEIGKLAPECIFFGAETARLPNTSCFATPGLASETQVMALDLAGICISSGSACSSGKVQASHVIAAMGAGDAASTIRVSLGWESKTEDVDAFLKAWRDHYQRSKGRDH